MSVGLDPEKVAQVAILRAAGLSQVDIAAAIGSSQQTVSRYCGFVRAVGLGLLREAVEEP